MIFPVKYRQSAWPTLTALLLRQNAASSDVVPRGEQQPPWAQMAHQHVIKFFLWPCNDGHHFTLFCSFSLLHSGFNTLHERSGGTQPIFTAQENGCSSFIFFSELLWSLGLIQLIKTPLMFVLMAPQRQLERRASVIPASDEASAQSLYGLQKEENSPTMQHPSLWRYL